jgi:hypothetical protein
MARRGRSLLFAAVVAPALLVAACGKQLDVAKPEQAILREVERAYSVDVSEVSCPEDLEAEAGATFKCVVVLPDDRLTVDVTQTDDEGGLRFELAEQLITNERVEQAIRRQYNATAVNCGRREYWVSRPGETFTCRARDDAGGTARIRVTVRDERGNIDLDIAS